MILLNKKLIKGGRVEPEAPNERTRSVIGGLKHSKTFTLVSALMSWEDARIHCRQHYTDLAMIEDEAEFNTVASLYPSPQVWVGLYREPWRWSDGSQAKFTNWANGQPDNYQFNQHCVKVDNSRGWHDENCQTSLPFHCEKGG
uniref:C-type lectin domain-containing protein n=1 Tax=Neogobius melanostomus TaxID=47308 RepID=A0A8C6V3D3_9GOBI